RTASFWHDDWTNAGPLLILTGPLGPQVSGIPLDATVSSVVREDGWSLSQENGVNEPPSPFSLSRLWTSLYQEPPRVSWYKAVWFGKQIPKHGDRMRSWGLDVPAVCLLCGKNEESIEHLFFQCHYSLTIAMVVPWIISIRLDRKLKTIYNLVIQAAVYFIWKERNSRLHNQTSKPAHSVVKDIYHWV
ncbi:hypothetical protein Bca52824_096155, partial [Brassica carinata]